MMLEMLQRTLLCSLAERDLLTSDCAATLGRASLQQLLLSPVAELQLGAGPYSALQRLRHHGPGSQRV